MPVGQSRLRSHARIAALVVGTCVLSSGCGNGVDLRKGKDAEKAANQAITVTMGQGSCKLSSPQVPAGIVVFDVMVEGDQPGNFSVVDQGKVAMVHDNIAPHTRTHARMLLPAGTFQVNCGSKQGNQSATLTTQGDPNAGMRPEAVAVVNTYQAWLKQQATDMVRRTEELQQAITAGNRDAAKAAYINSHIPWEAIEKTVEPLGGSVEEADPRELDLGPGENLEGWHQIERGLWTGEAVVSLKPAVDGLLEKVKDIESRVMYAPITPAFIAFAAKESLNECLVTKMVGLENSYSHTELYDIEAVVRATHKTTDILRPLLAIKNPGLADSVIQRVGDVDAALEKYRTSKSVYRTFDTLNTEERRHLARTLDGLDEAVSYLSATAEEATRP